MSKSIYHVIRPAMFALADELQTISPGHAERLRYLAEETRRRPSVRKGPRKHSPLTREQREMARRLKAEHPDWHEQDIAQAVAANAGRISETLNPPPEDYYHA